MLRPVHPWVAGLLVLGSIGGAAGCKDEPSAKSAADNDASSGPGGTGSTDIGETVGSPSTSGSQATSDTEATGTTQATSGTPTTGSAPGAGGSSATDRTAGGSGGSVDGGATGGNGGQSACEDFNCPDLGSCSAQQQGDQCIRTCALPGIYKMMTEEDVTRLADLGCNIIDGSLHIEGNQVGSLSGLGTISEVTRSFTLRSNGASSMALPPLRAVGESLTFIDLAALERIELPVLESVGESLAFTSNASLVSIELKAFKSVDTLQVGLNPELVTLSVPALDSAQTISISNNPKLPQCEVDELVSQSGALTCSPCEENDTTATCD